MDYRIITEISGWTGSILFIVGALAFAKKHISGFYMNGAANILYVIQAYLMKNWSLFWISVILIGINIKGIIDWSPKALKIEKYDGFNPETD